MTDHSTDPGALARQTQRGQTPDLAAPYAQSTVQANPAHQNPRPDHPGPVNPVTPAYSGSRGSEDDLEVDTLGPQPGATPPQNRPLDQSPTHDQSDQRGVSDDAPPTGDTGYRPAEGRSLSDADLKQQVQDRLNAHPLINHTEIDVQVAEGRVTLSGTVTDPETIRNATACLSPIAGIVAFYNELRTNPHDRNSASEQETSVPGRTKY